MNEIVPLKEWLDNHYITYSMRKDVLVIPGFGRCLIQNDYEHIFKEDKDGNVLHSERRYGQMSRQYRLPDVNKKDIKAQYKNGVLTITLPKKDETDDDENHIDIE